eukprot:jgi/Botrbrau1/6283/Bobra.0129s0028.1
MVVERCVSGNLGPLHHQGIPTGLHQTRFCWRRCFEVCRFTNNQRALRHRVSAEPSEQDQAAMREALDKAMQDPEMRERLQAAQAQMENVMKDPASRALYEQTAAVMSNQEIQKRMAKLKEDPELAPMFADIEKNGMAAMMKYWNDPATLAKLGEKMGDVQSLVAQSVPTGQAAGAPSPSAAPVPEINSLVDAAKHGDLEAVEDFLAIGRDVNAADDKGRTPLHYCVAYWNPDIADLLLQAGADVEAQDDGKNTPLHYAAGYARGEAVSRLLKAGASTAVVNKDGNTPLQLITSQPRNPLNQNSEILAQLETASSAAKPA